ncbi:right-handed parallel beta-helix repeat-containing protein [Tahibacter sp. UC22_41]|uniref:right-handed parallel beta-helix repeat-containing protein n=1 Tax=Tahibacter sp. UC22_41 TaxID=3350178 RepID=UPI0036DC84C2
MRRTMVMLATVLICSGAMAARVVPVSDVAALRAALQAAAPGDDIVLAAGTYVVDSNLNCAANGTSAAPIRVRAAVPRSVILRFGSSGGIVEGFRVSGAWWQLDGLDIEGACAVDGNCEHAVHVFGDAEHLLLRDNVLRDFNAQLKGNGVAQGGVYVYPDDVIVEYNRFYDTRARNTGNPVTKLDVVGGRRWIVRGNTFSDYQKLAGDGVSYAAFLKGNSRDGVFERNLVRCSQAFSGGVRLGLSFGGGGTSPDAICEDGSCTPEHQGGIMRNNIVMSCNDVGIYLNKAANTRLQHNTLYATSGIDVRYAASTAEVRNNLLGGAIRLRDGGTSTNAGNLTGVTAINFAAWFQAPDAADFRLRDGAAFVGLGVAAPQTVDDFCANRRSDGAPDIGALEYDLQHRCATDSGGGVPLRLFADGFDG